MLADTLDAGGLVVTVVDNVPVCRSKLATTARTAVVVKRELHIAVLLHLREDGECINSRRDNDDGGCDLQMKDQLSRFRRGRTIVFVPSGATPDAAVGVVADGPQTT